MLLPDRVSEHFIILNNEDEYAVWVDAYSWGFFVTVGVFYGLDEQGEPRFQSFLRLDARSKDEMLRRMPIDVKRLVAPELYEKLSRILAGEKAVR